MKDTPMTDEEMDFAVRILRTTTDFPTMNEIAKIVQTVAKENADTLTVTQTMALAAAAGIITGTAKGLQRERDRTATGGPITAMDI